jgi:MFS family permease
MARAARPGAAGRTGTIVGVSRRLILTCAIVLVDTIFFTALSPLLPQYADRFGLDKGALGLLAGAFAGGVLLAAIPSGFCTTRFGARIMTLVGLGLLGATSLAFGLAGGLGLLLGARFLGGIGSACSWTATVTWLTADAPRERRGELIGVAVSAAVVGGLLGPLLGSTAAAVGPAPAFGAVTVAAGALGAGVLRTPEAGRSGEGGGHGLGRALRAPGVAAGAGLIMLCPLLFATLSVLVPLTLARGGWGAAMIGGVYAVTAAAEAGVHPLLGRWSDRQGFRRPTRVALAAAAVVLLGLAGTDAPWPLAGLVLLAGLTFGATLVPGMALLTHSAEAAGLDAAMAFGLTNLAWALGYAIGAPAGGALAEAAGDAAAYVTLATLCLAALPLLGRVADPAPARLDTLGRDS